MFWSIPPEVQFYFFFVSIWWALQASSQSNYWPTAIVSITVFLMYMVSRQAPGTTLPSKLPFFLLGSAAGLVSARTRFKSFYFLCSLLQISLLSITALTCSKLIPLPRDEASDLYHSLIFQLLCALVVFSFSIPSWTGRIIFGNRVARELGAWSFALYLTHLACFYWANRIMHSDPIYVFAAGIVMSVAAASLLHQYIERPIQKLIKTLLDVLYMHSSDLISKQTQKNHP